MLILLLHRVPKKTKQICFCQNCVKFPPILIIFGRKMANDTNICEVHSFSTSPNVRHHLTVLNANVPNCYITPNVVICNKLRISSCNTCVQNCQNLCSKCAPRARTQALRRRRHWLIAASMIDWSNCAHSLTRHVLSSSMSAILERQF